MERGPSARSDRSLIDLTDLACATASLIRSARPSRFAPADVLETGAAVMENSAFHGPFAEREPRPACRYLDTVFAADRAAEVAPVLTAFEHAWRAMRWVVNSNYLGRPEMENYLANATYCELVGADGVVPSAEAAVGFLLMGPDVFYPAHHHPAAEAYFVLSGTAEWQADDGHWSARPPGARIFHPPHTPHAMRTRDEPLLALSIWTGDVETRGVVTNPT